MRYKHTKEIIMGTLKRAPDQPVLVMGPPGVAKTALCFEVGKELGLPDDRVLLFRPSLRDPVDLMGVPTIDDGNTVWATPEELAKFREGTGPGLIIWDELPQAVAQMQNAIAGALLDKVLGPLHLDKQVMQVATGNRTKDKAGANRIVSQLGNRVKVLEMDVHLDDWCQWALEHDIDPLVVAFVRMRPDMLHDFDPDRVSNPTPRSWEMVSRSCNPDLPRELYFQDCKGLVGESAAVEFTAFRDMYTKLPSVDAIMLDPLGVNIPEEPAVKFAAAAALAYRATPDNFAVLTKFMGRLPVEFGTMFMQDAFRRHKEIAHTKAFIEWVAKNQDVFL